MIILIKNQVQATVTLTSIRNGNKILLCTWWDIKDVYYRVLWPIKTRPLVTAKRYE